MADLKRRTSSAKIGNTDSKKPVAEKKVEPPYKSAESAMPKRIEYTTEYYNAGESKIRIGSRVFKPEAVINVFPIPKFFFTIGSIGTRKVKKI